MTIYELDTRLALQHSNHLYILLPGNIGLWLEPVDLGSIGQEHKYFMFTKKDQKLNIQCNGTDIHSRGSNDHEWVVNLEKGAHRVMKNGKQICEIRISPAVTNNVRVSITSHV